MLQVLLAPLSYNAGVVSRSSVAGQRSAAPLMVKSESLPFMEEPAHLSGMVGNVGFDPMGLSTPQNIKWMREAELKHGRICQLAWAVRAAPHAQARRGRGRLPVAEGGGAGGAD